MVQHLFTPPGGKAFTNQVDVMGYVALNSSGAIVPASCILPGMMKVTKTAGNGNYTVVIDQPFKKSCVNVTFEAATAVDLVPQVTPLTVTAAGVSFIVRLCTGATPTNPAAACGFHIQFSGTNTTVSKY